MGGDGFLPGVEAEAAVFPAEQLGLLYKNIVQLVTGQTPGDLRLDVLTRRLALDWMRIHQAYKCDRESNRGSCWKARTIGRQPVANPLFGLVALPFFP